MSAPLVPSSTPLNPPTSAHTTPTPTDSPTPPPTSNGASTTSSTPSGTAQTTAVTSNSGSSSTPSTGPTPVTTQQFASTGGAVVPTPSTSVVIATQTPTSPNNSPNSNSFFSNKGAVAGVFSVVGVIAVALIIALIINGIRRRRAEKFDRDVAEAAAEAAASSRSPFDDYGYSNSGGNGGGPGGVGYGYSDNSHGTYQLPPLSPQNAPYGMTEMSQYDPYAAGAAPLAAAAVGRSRSRKDSDPRAPGIAGVGAGTLAREPTKRAPYHAFAGPAPQPYDIQGDAGRYGSRRSNHDILEAAGLGSAGAAAAFANTTTNNNGASGAYVTRKPSDTTQNTQFSGGRSKFGSVSSSGHHPTPLQPGYPVESYYPQRNDSLSPDPFAGYPVTTAPSQGFPNPHDATTPGPLPSVAGHQSDHVEDYVDTGSPTALRSDEQRMSYQDNTDYSQGHRVLRVANE